MLNVSEQALRFWRKIDRSGDCWTWMGATNLGGYGRFAVDGRRVMAHRVAYTLTVGQIPDGMQLDHLCRNRICVNPDHLEPVTQAENILRGVAPSAINARRTECAHGHVFTQANTYITGDGRRQCRQCSKARRAKWKARRKDASLRVT